MSNLTDLTNLTTSCDADADADAAVASPVWCWPNGGGGGGGGGGQSQTSVERVLTNLVTSLNTHPSGVVVFDRLIVPKEVCSLNTE